MGFLQPLVLFALGAAAIPTLLHLLGRRLPPTVIFPAVRYLTLTEREHSRRLKLRNLLLLILRTAVIIFLVLAAARPMARIGTGGSHPPTALALIVDNSLSAGAVVEGRRALAALVDAARQVLNEVGPQDRLWLVVADGVPQRLTRLEAHQMLDSLAPAPVRLDLGSAVRAAATAVASDPLPGHEVVMFSDLQMSALPPGAPTEVRVLAWRPPKLPENRWIDSAFSDPPVWSPEGAVIAAVGGFGTEPATVSLTVADRNVARAVAIPGDRVVLSGNLEQRGWTIATVELDPDELRADDRRTVALYLTDPVAALAQEGAGEFVTEGLQVLRDGGRALQGTQVVLDERPSPTGPTVVFPPGDPALVGALNRALAARGVGWRYGALLEGEWQLAGDLGAAGNAPVYRRHRLVGSGNVLATVSGDAWLVRDNDLVLVASRMEPEWTALPVSAAFIPFIDRLVNRIAADESWIVSAAPRDVVELPATASALITSSGRVPVPSDRRVTAPFEPGVYYLESESGDTIGALEVNYDPRESELDQADERFLRGRFGPETRLLSGRSLGRQLFRATSRADLTGLLIAAAILAAIAEFIVASAGSRRESAADAA